MRTLWNALPSSQEASAFLAQRRPDLVLVTPLVELRSKQVDYVSSAQALKIPTGLCVASWDNLTNKGLIHAVPDRVIVWNEYQKQEAVELHDVPADRVRITGCQSFDPWFEQRPSTTREEFCARVGLDANRPYILYLCSSGFVSGRETEFVQKWLGELRSRTDSRLRNAGVLIRPHPVNGGQWLTMDLGDDNARIWPRRGAFAMDDASRAEYFDSMYFSSAVVGVNTSGFIEAGVVGKVSHTVLAPEFAGGQEGTLHFSHLKHHGFLKVGSTFAEHFTQLGRTLRDGPEEHRTHVRPFLVAFVRPHGLDQPTTPQVADAIEELGQVRVPAASRGLPGARFASVCLVALALFIYVLNRLMTIAWETRFATVRKQIVRATRRLATWLGRQSGDETRARKLQARVVKQAARAAKSERPTGQRQEPSPASKAARQTRRSILTATGVSPVE